jgi:hypothetical protein
MTGWRRRSSFARRALVTVAAGVLAAVVGLPSAPASAQALALCTTTNSGYYCYHTGTNGGGSTWIHDSCWSNAKHSYPSWLWDEVRSWHHRQHSGAWLSNWNWLSNIAAWGFKFNMTGQSSDSNVPDEGDAGADTLENHC